MKKKSTSQSAFFNLRILIAVLFCLAGIAVALFGSGAFSSAFAQTRGTNNNQSPGNRDAPGTQSPDVVRMVGPVRLDQDLRDLPFIPPKAEFEEQALMRYPHGTGETGTATGYGVSGLAKVQELLKGLSTPATMPPPLLTFDGTNRVQSGCNCAPPDTDGDVGPNHYVQAVNVSFRVFDKTGVTLAGPTTYNSLFAPLTGTACSGFNDGDPFVISDQVADRWVVSDFAFPSFPGVSFWQCIGVSRTSDPVSGGWWLYAIQVDPANPTYLGDYPKFGLWPDAYYLSMNEFSNNTTFNGVRVYALNRNSMVNGGSAHAIGFSILPANLGNQYSLVPASFRTGNPPPAGQPEWFMDVNSSAIAGTVETQVFVRRFHADFGTPANSSFGA